MSTVSQPSIQDQEPAFRHEALLYDGVDGFLAGTVPFVREALQRDEPVLVMVGEAKIDAMREALNGVEHADRVQFADMEKVGSNPARIIPAWRSFVDGAAGGGRPLRGIGEPIWAERSAAELVECQHHESLLNLAFAQAPPMRLLCPYDTDALPPDVIAEAQCSHPFIAEGGVERDSGDYRGLDAVAAPFSVPLPPAPAAARRVSFDATTLHAVRVSVAVQAEAAGLCERRVEDLVLAVSEAAANSVRHGGGRGDVTLWSDDAAVLCEVRDHGSFDRPLAGREEPAADRVGGMGLWIANQMCDLVQIRSTSGGTVVRLHMRRA